MEPSSGALGVDVGGTFTDFVLWQEGEIRTLKLPSTPHDPSVAILEGSMRLCGGAPALLIHGSTIATNTLIERRGARVALIATAGFEDLLFIGRQDRPQLFELEVRRPPPLVEPDCCFGIAERIGPGGRVERPLTADAILALKRRLESCTAETVAICLLHSYARPAHELRLERELGPIGRPICLSHRILRQIREYERASTTVASAYLLPRIESYLQRLIEPLRHSRVEILCSDGSRLPLAAARQYPARLALSGPAGGAVAALALLRQLGIERALAFDMGGTSTDVSLVAGELPLVPEREVAGVPIYLPSVDIHTVGAGGGSIAWVDPGGALKVGPQSAGAAPGPACYGRGEHLTVTDANLLLGRLIPETFLGGALPIYRERAEAAAQPLSARLSLEQTALAEGVVRIVIANMARALRAVSVERGFDPRRLPLVAFGGAAGLHAAGLMEELDLPQVILPPLGGLLSAYGMLWAEPSIERSRTLLLPYDDPALPLAQAEIVAEAVAEARAQGLEEVELKAWAELRYLGQGQALRLAHCEDPDQLRQRFEQAHRQLYGYIHEGRTIEILNLGVRAVAPALSPPLQDRVEGPTSRPLEPRPVIQRGRTVEAAIWRRSELPEQVGGPVVVVESNNTVWVPGGFRLRRDRGGVLTLERDR